MTASLGEFSLDDAGRATLRIPPAAAEFLLVPILMRGVGSYRIGLDRGQPGPVRHVRWRRAGDSMVLVQLNLRYINSLGEGVSIPDSFAQSALFRTPVLDEDERGVLVDVSGLATRDFVGLRERIAAEHGPAALDPALSWLAADETYQHAGGIELTAFLTIAGAQEDALRVAPDASAVTVTQRLTLLPLPEPPLEPRRYHPLSGGYGKRFLDLSLAQNRSQESGWQPRFRLERLDEGSPSRVAKPIVFSIDPEIPQPWRDAIVDGGNWWRDAFERAGFLDAYRVEVSDSLTDPARADVNAVWWVHRADRGPSFGNGITDPRTGEILKGNVRLGAQRLQQLTQLGEALLSPYGRPDEAERLAAIDTMVISRMRHLAAHEIGHALGFMHNFASQLDQKPSVTDYPFPALALDERGEIDLAHTYSTSLGPWDYYLVCSAYEQFPPGEEAERLAELRREVFGRGQQYLTDDDGNAASGSHPAATPWTFGADAITTLDTILAVRAKAIADFDRGAAPLGVQAGELEKRFALVHLLHRYQVSAIAKLVGGVGYGYGDASDPATAPVPVHGELQSRALSRLCTLLAAEVTEVPDAITALIAPPSIRFGRGSGDFSGQLGPLFDPLAATAAASSLVCQSLLEPSRLNRMSAAHARDATNPGPAEALRLACDAVASGGSEQALETVRAVIAEQLIDTLRSGRLHAAPRSELLEAIAVDGARLGVAVASELTLLLADPTRPSPWPRTVIPEGWPL